MNQPSLYKSANVLQRRDAKEIVHQFASHLQLRSDGKDSLIDIGSGSGDVLIDFILPTLPDTYARVVGIDISTKMIQFSKRAYAAYDRVDFKVLDIATEDMPPEYHKKFDHVTSFFCLHWVQNQRQALENIYNMLVNGGDCLLVFLTSCPIFELYIIQSANPKWKEYLKDKNEYIPPSQEDPDPWKTYTALFNKVGFIDHTLEVRHKEFYYEGCENFKSHCRSINPFIGRMSAEEQQEYINDFLQIWEELGLREEMADKDGYRYKHPYKMAVVYARK